VLPFLDHPLLENWDCQVFFFFFRVALRISIAVAKDLFSRIPFALVLFHKFMEQVEKIFENLHKPLKWRSFYKNDLPILMDISEDVQKRQFFRNFFSQFRSHLKNRKMVQGQASGPASSP